MRFRTREKSARYVIEPSDVVTLHGRTTDRVVGLSVQAVNNFIDTDALARSQRWTDEQHNAVLLKLLQHPMLGRSMAGANPGALTIAPGSGQVNVDRDIPQSVEDAMPGIRAEVAERLGLARETAEEPSLDLGTCIHPIENPDGTYRTCKNKKVVGDFCKTHAPAEVPA